MSDFCTGFGLIIGTYLGAYYIGVIVKMIYTGADAD